MRDLIIHFGEASDDDLKKMIGDIFKKSQEMKKEVSIVLYDASLRLKRLK